MIRRRFLDTYQRDIKGKEELLKGSKAIRLGKIKAHKGDALGDATVFARDKRSDQMLYQELYGLTSDKVLYFGMYENGFLCQELTKCIDSATDNGGLFPVLNAHATMLAQGKTPSDDLEKAFHSFLAKFEENWPHSPNNDPTTPLGAAYHTFWEKHNEQSST